MKTEAIVHKLCTAIFNPFSGYYYVDDIYGVIEESKKE